MERLERWRKTVERGLIAFVLLVLCVLFGLLFLERPAPPEPDAVVDLWEPPDPEADASAKAEPDDGAYVPDVPMCRPGRWESYPQPQGMRCEDAGRVRRCVVGEPYDLDRLGIAEISGMLDAAERAFGRLRPGRLDVILYDHKSWTTARTLRAMEGAVGIYDGQVHVDVEPGPKERVYGTLRHEIGHAVLSETTRCLPRSVHEGLVGWFAGEHRTRGWVDLLMGVDGWMTPNGMERAIEAQRDTTRAAYAQATARVFHAVEVEGDGVVQRWLDRLDPPGTIHADKAWAELGEEPTEDAVVDTIVEVGFGIGDEGWDATFLTEVLEERRLWCMRTFNGPAWGPDRFGRGAILRYCRPIAPDEMEALIAEFRFAFVIPEETSDAEARRIRQDHYIDR